MYCIGQTKMIKEFIKVQMFSTLKSVLNNMLQNCSLTADMAVDLRGRQ